MTEQEQKNVRAYCAFLLSEYGFEFTPTDPVIPALYIIHKEMQVNNKNNQAIASMIEKTSSRINPKVYQFSYPGESWKFQLGIAFKWLLGGGLAVLLLWTGVWYWSMKQEIDRARIILESSKNLPKLIEQIRVDDHGYFFIDFTSTKGDSVIQFKEYRRINAKTVRVYLGHKGGDVY